MNNNKGEEKPIFEIIVLLIIIIPLIVISFIYSIYKFQITIPIIILVCLLVVILLSARFDNFQIGKIFTLNKNISEYKAKNEKLEEEKNELVKQLINFNLQSQHTSNMNFNGIPWDEIKRGISVEKATPEDIKDNKTEEEKENIKNKSELKETNKIINRTKLEALAIKKCFGTINYGSIVTSVKVNTNKFNNIDPISNRNIIFDAFYNDNEVERFIEVASSAMSSIFWDRLYVMLNKVYHYRKIKNSNSNLTLIIAKLPESENRRQLYYIDRLKEIFLPAISSGLLNILEVEISKEELNEISDII